MRSIKFLSAFLAIGLLASIANAAPVAISNGDLDDTPFSFSQGIPANWSTTGASWFGNATVGATEFGHTGDNSWYAAGNGFPGPSGGNLFQNVTAAISAAFGGLTTGTSYSVTSSMYIKTGNFGDATLGIKQISAAAGNEPTLSQTIPAADGTWGLWTHTQSFTYQGFGLFLDTRWNGNLGINVDTFSMEANLPAPACIIGDGDCDGYVDVGGDILPAFTNFTGPGSFGKTRANGDVEGDGTGATTNPAGHDGDVDVPDLLAMFGAFTGPPPDGSGGLVAAEALDPNIPDLIYDSATGEVTLDVDSSGIIGYVLKNGSGTFVPGSHTQILVGVVTSTVNELSEAAFASAGGSIGNVFPTGMDLAALTAYLTVNDVSRSLGAPVVPFDLVVLTTGPAVPEPTSFAMLGLGLLGLGYVAYRRRSS